MFSRLGCSQHRNITIILDGVYKPFYRRFVFLLRDVLENKDCYTVNFYDTAMKRFTLFKDENHELNLISNSFNPTKRQVVECNYRAAEKAEYLRRKLTNEMKLCLEEVDQYNERYLPKYRKIAHALTLLFENSPEVTDSVRQTFVLMVQAWVNVTLPTKLLRDLKTLQSQKSWDIIFLCLSYPMQCPTENWIPRHRVLQLKNNDFDVLPDLIDLIKDPDFDRFKFQRALEQSNSRVFD